MQCYCVANDAWTSCQTIDRWSVSGSFVQFRTVLPMQNRQSRHRSMEIHDLMLLVNLFHSPMAKRFHRQLNFHCRQPMSWSPSNCLISCDWSDSLRSSCCIHTNRLGSFGPIHLYLPRLFLTVIFVWCATVLIHENLLQMDCYRSSILWCDHSVNQRENKEKGTDKKRLAIEN